MKKRISARFFFFFPHFANEARREGWQVRRRATAARQSRLVLLVKAMRDAEREAECEEAYGPFLFGTPFRRRRRLKTIPTTPSVLFGRPRPRRDARRIFARLMRYARRVVSPLLKLRKHSEPAIRSNTIKSNCVSGTCRRVPLCAHHFHVPSLTHAASERVRIANFPVTEQ